MTEQQMEMFAATPAPARFRETKNFHESVLFLRREGIEVRRCGSRQSLVDGSLIDNHALVRFARWVKENKK